MIKTLEKSGRTEDDAINAALKELGLDRDDVSVEIVERAKSGFLGIGASPAVVRVSYEAPDEEPAPSTASAPANITPASMVITINDTAVDVAATSCSEGMVIFEYDKMTEAVTAAGFSSADIDDIAIKTTGAPIDVYKITILQC